MQSPVKVSVVIPIYNQSRFVSQAIESVLAQTLTNIEIIVVNDGSEDDPTTALAPYMDSVQYIEQKNQGVSAARNAGLAIAKGTYILFLDADDFITPDKLSAKTYLLDHNPQCGMVVSGWWLCDEQGEITSVEKQWFQAPQLDLLTWLRWKPGFPGAILFRTKAVQQVGGFATDLTHSEDVDLALRILIAKYGAMWLKLPTAYYRQHSTSAVRNVTAAAQGIKIVLDRTFYNQNLPASIRPYEDKIRYHTYIWFIYQLYKNNNIEGLEEFIRLSFKTAPYVHGVQITLDILHHLILTFFSQGGTVQDILGILPYIRHSFIPLLRADEVKNFDTMMDWLSEVWIYYLMDEDNHHINVDLTKFQDTDVKALIEFTQPLLYGMVRSISIESIEQFIDDLKIAGIVTKQTEHHCISLYLTLFASNIFRRDFAHAAAALFQAIRYTTTLQAMYPWLLFVRKAFIYFAPNLLAHVHHQFDKLLRFKS